MRTDYTSRASPQTCSKTNGSRPHSHRAYVRNATIDLHTTLPIIQNGDPTLVWITTPRLLPCFILPILMKISKGTDAVASDHCSVCPSGFTSARCVNKKERTRRKICGFSNNARSITQEFRACIQACTQH